MKSLFINVTVFAIFSIANQIFFFSTSLLSQQRNSSSIPSNSNRPSAIYMILRDKQAIERLDSGKTVRVKSPILQELLTELQIQSLTSAATNYHDPFPNKDTAFVVQHPLGYPIIRSNRLAKEFILQIPASVNLDSAISRLQQLPIIEEIFKLSSQ